MLFRSYISYDIEARGLDRFTKAVTLLGFGNTKYQYIIPLEVRYSPLRGKRIAQKKLVRYAINKLNTLGELSTSNGKFDNLFLHYHFGLRPEQGFDVMLASHCLDENSPNGLKENAIFHCNAVNWDIKKHLKTGNVQNREDYEDYKQYLGYDIYFTSSLHKKLKKRLKAELNLWNLFYHIYMPVSNSYEDVQLEGVYVDQSKFGAAETYLKDKLAEIIKELNRQLRRGIKRKEHNELVEKYVKNNKGKGVKIKIGRASCREGV